MTRQHTLTLAVVIIGISTVAAQVLKPTGQAPASAQVPDTPQPHGAEAVSLIAAPGRVEPISEEIDVAAELQGRLTDVLVDEGAQVTRGQVVARLEHADYDARLQSAQARLAVAAPGDAKTMPATRADSRSRAGACGSATVISCGLTRPAAQKPSASARAICPPPIMASRVGDGVMDAGSLSRLPRPPRGQPGPPRGRGD